MSSVSAWGQPDGSGNSSTVSGGVWNNNMNPGHGSSGPGGGGGGNRSIWGSSGGNAGGGGPPNQGSQWGSNNASNIGRGSNSRQMGGGGGWDRHNTMNAGGAGQSHRFNSAPGTAPRPIGAWNAAEAAAGAGVVPTAVNPNGAAAAVVAAQAPGGSLFSQTSNNSASQSQSKVNPNNIWNIPGVAADASANTNEPLANPNAGSVRPMPSVTPASNIGQNAPSSAGANGDGQQDSFTNIGIWEPTEPKDKDPDSDPKGTRLWAAYMMQSRGQVEDKTMGGKLKVPSFQSVEEMSDQEKRLLLERLINTHEGWGKITVNQETSWDETMNVFNRSESISSDKTHSDNADSPTSLNDPSSFPLMSKSANNSAVSLVSPTSKAGDGWGSPQGGADGIQQSMRGGAGNAAGSLNRTNSGQALMVASDDAGTSAWGKQPPPGPAWTSSQNHESAMHGSHSSAAHANHNAQLQASTPGSSAPGCTLPSPNAWDKPLKSPSLSNPGVAGPMVNERNNSNDMPPNSATAWPQDTAAAAGKIIAAITTAPPISSLPNSTSDVWSKSAESGNGGDSWDNSVHHGLSSGTGGSDMWNLDDKSSGVLDSMRNNQQSQQSSRVPSPSPLDAVNEELFKANNAIAAIQHPSVAISSKLPKSSLSGQMITNNSSMQQQSTGTASGNSAISMQGNAPQRPSNFGSNLGGFLPSDSPGPLDLNMTAGILDQDNSSSLFSGSGGSNKYQQQQQQFMPNPGNRGVGAGSGSMSGNFSMMMQQQQQANALKQQQQQQQQMHHLELASKAGLLPRNTNLRIIALCGETPLTVQYKECLQKYAQTKFALQKLKAQYPYKNTQMQNQPRNPQVALQFNELVQSMKNYDGNLNTLEQICNKLFADVQAQAALQLQSPQAHQTSNLSGLSASDLHSGAAMLGGGASSGNNGGNSSVSRLHSWMSNSGSNSNPGSATGLEDNVFDMGNQGGFNPMQYGGNKMGSSDKSGKAIAGAFSEFVPGQIWTGSKDYANDPDATPASANTWQSAVNERDIINLQYSLKQMGTGGSHSSGGGPSMGDFSSLGGMKSSGGWNSNSSAGFDMTGAGDMWRQQQTRMNAGNIGSKSWNAGPYGAPGMGSAASLSGGTGGGNSAKWQQQNLRNQSMSGGGYQNFAPSNMSPQRPNMGQGFAPGAFRGSASGNTHGSQNMMGGGSSGWNYPNNLMGGGGASFDMMHNFGPVGGANSASGSDLPDSASGGL